MTDSEDDRLATLLTQDAPPASDAYFRLAVMQRLEQRQFVRQAVGVGVLGVAGVVVMLGVSPSLPDIGTHTGLVWMALAATGAGLALAFYRWPRLI